jgi:prevent-host-death family protein
MHSKVVGVRELQQRMESIFEDVTRKQVPYVVTDDSEPQAALVPYAEFLRFQKFQESDVLSRFDRVMARLAEHNAGFSEEEVEADVAAARDELPA